MRESHTIVLASENRGKLEEFESLFRSYPSLEIKPASAFVRNSYKIGLAEKHSTYVENAIAKARLINHACHYPSLADDSGLEVMALEGKPGIHTKRFAIPKAGQSQDQANIEKMLMELKDVPKEQRQARFVAALALEIEGVLVYSEGTLEGEIATEARGDAGFGYDPIFIPKGSTKTLAQMDEDEKNAISHRAIAFQRLMDEIDSKGISLAKP